MIFYDIHTHRNELETEVIPIVNYIVGFDDYANLPTKEDFYKSVGIHPWFIWTENVDSQFKILQEIATASSVAAIGEAGFDKNSPVDFSLQKKVFLQQVLVSEESQKPLIIHCVKSFDGLIEMKKLTKPNQAWIIHGFRGKKEQAKQLIKQNFLLSFGDKLNEDTLKNVPIEKIFLESDDSGISIKLVYEKASKIIGVKTEDLAEQIRENVNRCFF